MLSPRVRFLPALALAAGLAAAGPAAAQMTPLSDLRRVYASASSGAVNQTKSFTPPTAFDYWAPHADAQAIDPDAGEASASAWQVSQFLPSSIFASGGATGEYQVAPGSYSASSYSTMTFQTATCMTWSLDATVEGADPPGAGQADIALNVVGGPEVIGVQSGHATIQGRLGPGTYWMDGRSSVVTNGDRQQAPTYSIVWTCQPCSSPLIGLQPAGVVVSSGASTSFSVTTTAAAAGAVFQWRRNNVPLSNGGHYNGVTTSVLSVSSASLADTGFYNVVVTSGGVVEPSGFAHLTLSGATGVAPSAPVGVAFRIEPATPNPSVGATTFRFTAERPLSIDAAIYDAAGRLVRPLASGVLSGPGTWQWDGHAASGVSTPAGIYFLRVRADGHALVQRFVRMR